MIASPAAQRAALQKNVVRHAADMRAKADVVTGFFGDVKAVGLQCRGQTPLDLVLFCEIIAGHPFSDEAFPRRIGTIWGNGFCPGLRRRAKHFSTQPCPCQEASFV